MGKAGWMAKDMAQGQRKKLEIIFRTNINTDKIQIQAQIHVKMKIQIHGLSKLDGKGLGPGAKEEV